MENIALNCANAFLGLDPEGTFHLRWPPGSIVTAPDARAVIAAVQAMNDFGQRPMLVEITDVHITLEARTVLLGQNFVSAVGLIGATVVDRVLAAALIRNQKCPSGYFTSVNAAREWLNQLPVPDALEGSPV